MTTRFFRLHLRTTDVDAARAFYDAVLGAGARRRRAARDAVRAAGGLVLDPVTLPNGDRVAVCDDPQGAAFALHARG